MSCFEMATIDNADLLLENMLECRPGDSDAGDSDQDRLRSLGLGAGYFDGPVSGVTNRSTATLDQPINRTSEPPLDLANLMYSGDEAGKNLALDDIANLMYSEDDEREAGGSSSLGFGLWSGPLGDGDRADLLYGRARHGEWRDQEGRTNRGTELDGAGLRYSGTVPDAALGPIAVDGSFLTANAHRKINEETASIGAQANLAEGSVTVGDKENSARLGLGLGLGFGGRAHYGDSDGDGVRELGFGFDAGPVSFDVKSELPHHAWNLANDAHDTLFGGLVEYGPDPSLLDPGRS